MAPSLLETAVFLLAITTLPIVCILRGTPKSRQLGIVLALGGGMALVLSTAFVIWGIVSSAASDEEAWSVIIGNDIFFLRHSWRIIFGSALCGMIVSWLSYIAMGPYLMPRVNHDARNAP